MIVAGVDLDKKYTMEERPLCSCHGKPKGWSKDKRYHAGGYWQCSVKQAAWQRKVYARNRDFVAAIKLERGCADCGYRAHPDALEFDHLDRNTKRDAVGLMLLNSRDLILAEIAKCEVVCANCHRIRTATRKATDA